MLENNMDVLVRAQLSVLEKSTWPVQKLKSMFFDARQPKPIKKMTSFYFMMLQVKNDDFIRAKVDDAIIKSKTDAKFQYWLSVNSKRGVKNYNLKVMFQGRLKSEIELDHDLYTEMLKIDESLTNLNIGRKTNLYDSNKKELNLCLDDSLNLLAGTEIAVKKDFIEKMNQYVQKNDEFLNTLSNNDCDKGDLIQLVKTIEKDTKTDMKLTANKKTINRKCRDILNDFNRTIMMRQNDIAKKPVLQRRGDHFMEEE